MQISNQSQCSAMLYVASGLVSVFGSSVEKFTRRSSGDKHRTSALDMCSRSVGLSRIDVISIDANMDSGSRYRESVCIH